jgi:hypothetical protein
VNGALFAWDSFSEGLIGLNDSLGWGQFSSINSGTLAVMTTTSLMIHKSTEKFFQATLTFDAQARLTME